jgi:hypothetical protein
MVWVKEPDNLQVLPILFTMLLLPVPVLYFDLPHLRADARVSGV